MRRLLRDRTGMALVLTLLAVSFLVAVTVQLGTSVNWQMQAAANQGNIVRLDAMLMSGLNLARAALLADQLDNEVDTVFDRWAEFDPDILAALFTEGNLQIKITDLSGLLQVNALVLTEEEKNRRAQEEEAAGRDKKTAAESGKGQVRTKQFEQIQRDLWQRFLLSESGAVEDEDAAAGLVDSLADWLDEDDTERERGAERGYYSSLDPPYVAANRPVMFAEELLLVRGWKSTLLYGDKEYSGIIDSLTITGQDGKININTAPASVLQALHGEMTEEFAADLVDFRNEKENAEQLAHPDWYRQVSGFPGDITFDKELITTRSSYFQVTITARVGELQRRGEAVIYRRENNEQDLLYWKVK